MLRSVIVAFLAFAAALAVSPARADVGAKDFDGRWLMTQTCPPASGRPALANSLTLSVKDGHASGEMGAQGRPGWHSVEGQIQANGNAYLHYSGLLGGPQQETQGGASGLPYDFDIQAHFDSGTGTGIRTKYRTCTFAFRKISGAEQHAANEQRPLPNSLPPGVRYTWSGPGNVIGLLTPFAGPKLGGEDVCAWRKGTIDIMVSGARLTGLFRRIGRPPVHFEASLATDGLFKVDVKDEPFVPSDLSHHQISMHDLGYGHAKSGLDDGLWHVSGVIAEQGSSIRIEGPCVYAGPLTKK